VSTDVPTRSENAICSLETGFLLRRIDHTKFSERGPNVNPHRVPRRTTKL
jgi:hypothetical protein